MLVCNVSLRPPRTAISAAVAEAATAADGATTGNIIFAALVDDPANVGDHVDAYLGEVMVEVATAAATVTAGLTYSAAIVEAATATDAAAGALLTIVLADVAETASASATEDASIVVAPATWDPATAANVTLSGGDLVVTNTSAAAATGARVASAAGKASGKYYFEITLTTEVGGGNTGFGVATTASTYTAMGNNATAGGEVFLNGGIYANSANTGLSITNPVNGDVIGIAVDLTNHKIWFRNHTHPNAGGGWNGGASILVSDPANNLGGATLPTGTLAPICTFGLSGTGNVFTANFGATAFTGTVPTGFTSGWI